MRRKRNTLLFLAGLSACLSFCTAGAAEDLEGLTFDHSLELSYAECFSVEYYTDEADNSYAKITLAEDQCFLLIPEGANVPEGLPSEVTPLFAPLDSMYLVATSAMDYFAALDTMDHLRLSGTQAGDWYVEEAKEAMEAGDLVYAGKYSAPDYERIVSEGCDLALESTMIYHTPEVQEKLEAFGIPVLVEHSSYESEPLGRLEWIRLYGVLTGEEEKAEAFFEAEEEKLKGIEGEEHSEETVAFFYINSNGMANVRKSNDYVAKMIDLAGGTYIFSELGGEDENALSTMNLQMEEFYAGALDADILVYNSAIDGMIPDLNTLFSKSELLADFKAVKEGRVFCTTQNLFQKSTGMADLIVDLHKVIYEPDVSDEELTYLYRVNP